MSKKGIRKRDMPKKWDFMLDIAILAIYGSTPLASAEGEGITESSKVFFF